MTRPWLARRIAETARRAQAETCPDCGAAVLRGPDEDMCAVVVSVEIDPAPPLVAIAAWLAGLVVCERDSAGELWRLDDHALGAGPRRRPTHIEHDCQHRARERSWKGPAELVPARDRASGSRPGR